LDQNSDDYVWYKEAPSAESEKGSNLSRLHEAVDVVVVASLAAAQGCSWSQCGFGGCTRVSLEPVRIWRLHKGVAGASANLATSPADVVWVLCYTSPTEVMTVRHRREKSIMPGAGDGDTRSRSSWSER
jgi:hypothetical protein